MLSLPRHVPLLVVAVALATATAMPASAQEARREGRAEQGARMAEPRPQGQGSETPRPMSSLSDSVRRVQRETGGRILGAEPPHRHSENFFISDVTEGGIGSHHRHQVYRPDKRH